MSDKPARKLVDGKVGDRYEIAEDYKGKHENAVGVPLDKPQGKAMPIPPGAPGPPKVTVVERPDYRKVDKKEPLFKKET